ncbi:Protein of unknown function [Gryllus bimaculatus]|nr:Protein of unknown function [Gryllus bimaculatus]
MVLRCRLSYGTRHGRIVRVDVTLLQKNLADAVMFGVTVAKLARAVAMKTPFDIHHNHHLRKRPVSFCMRSLTAEAITTNSLQTIVLWPAKASTVPRFAIWKNIIVLKLYLKAGKKTHFPIKISLHVVSHPLFLCGKIKNISASNDFLNSNILNYFSPIGIMSWAKFMIGIYFMRTYYIQDMFGLQHKPLSNLSWGFNLHVLPDLSEEERKITRLPGKIKFYFSSLVVDIFIYKFRNKKQLVEIKIINKSKNNLKC